MSKRGANEALDGHEAYLKRQKLSNPIDATTTGSDEEIRSGKQLKQLLHFSQDSNRSRHAIQSFKLFLDSFSNSEVDKNNRTDVLRDFLESQKSYNDEEKEDVFLPDLMQIWSLASETNDDRLLSAVPAVLALLLRTLSNILEFSDHGLRLARTLLLKPQQDLLARCLTSSKGKEFVISPSLRLLKEIASFDGGVLAKQVFRGRDQNLKGLARNLGLRLTTASPEDPRKPSVRTNALRFLLSLIKFLPSDAKRELLNQRDIVAALTRDIKDDPPYMIRDILETLKMYVLLDEALPRESKTRVVNGVSLGRISVLYYYDQQEEQTVAPRKEVDEVAHEFLTLACTSPSCGVLTRQSGFYPRGIDPDDVGELESGVPFIDLGLDSVEWMYKFTDKVPVKNTILSDFIQNLRPWSNAKQGDLLLSILRAAPELFADYFYGKRDFSFDPKLTATWMGYSAFVFSAIHQPVPAFFGYRGKYPRLPPPIAIVLENVLPQPLSQKVLTRCLTIPDNSLITFFSIRILCVAFTKVKKILEMYKEAASGSSSIWTQAAEELVENFCERCPSIQNIIVAFRKMKVTDLMQREAVTKLLVLYYEVVPQIALDAKFGVSAALVESLQASEDTDSSPQERALRGVELENLFQFAQFSPGMRWFTKIEGLPLCPFTAMLQLYARAAPELPLLKLRSVLGLVAKEHQVLQTTTELSALDVLVLQLQEIDVVEELSAIYAYLDDCISRCATKPMKYILALEEFRLDANPRNSTQGPLSLLSAAVVEQWPFLLKSVDKEIARVVAKFFARFIAALIKIEEDAEVLHVITQMLAKESSIDPVTESIFKHASSLVEEVSVPKHKSQAVSSGSEIAPNGSMEREKSDILAAMSGTSGTGIEDHKSLTRWVGKEAHEVIDEGHAAGLIILLSSEHLGIRKEAATNISKFAAHLKDSSVEEKEQIWLLLSEVVETARLIIDKEPLPAVITTFASRAVGVLMNPLHFLYGKVNKFLSNAPTWKLDKIPLMHKIMNEQPTIDDAHYLELDWLLSCLIAGLRTPADMALYRNRRVFENVLSTYHSTNLPPGIRDKVLQVLFKACSIEGGSTTLITRFSAMTWLEAQVAHGGGTPLKVLMEQIVASCDQKRVNVWSKGSGSMNKDMLKF